MRSIHARHRSLLVCRGCRVATAAEAYGVVGSASAALWVGDADGAPVETRTRREVARRLGDSCDAVVLDLHDGFDGDTLGRVHGMIRGGGMLILRLPEASLSGRLGRWVERHLAASPGVVPDAAFPVVPVPMEGSAEQDELVEVLLHRMGTPEPSVSVLVADRGRGKSAALGRVLKSLSPDGSVALTGPHPHAVSEVVRFAARSDLRFVDSVDLLDGVIATDQPSVVVIDEAAQIPVPLLQALCVAAPRAHFIFATTVHGYEGSGRGFAHRFVPWLETHTRPVHHHALSQPIRWTAGDPLERWVSEVLALSAVPSLHVPVGEPVRVEHLDRDRLLDEPRLLHDVFGLLVAAHYRTTPTDLQHLLDDPEAAIHAVRIGDAVAAVGWLVADGRLDPDTIRSVAGGQRPRGRALADFLICHCGYPNAARLKMWRSVRTAVHPALRRQGLAGRLVEHEHAHHGDADLIGTLFGATPDLIRMRRALGYEVVRLGFSRSARSGMPSVLMVRPHTEVAEELVADLRRDLARDLPGQLSRMNRVRGVPLDPALEALLRSDLPLPSVWTATSVATAMDRYLQGATPIDALGDAPRQWLVDRPGWEQGLPSLEARAMRLRVLEDLPWHHVAQQCGARTVRVVQRAVRRGMVQVGGRGDL